LRIAIIFEFPELCGGVTNAAGIGRLLLKVGHRVTICAHGAPPAWLEWKGDWHDHQGYRCAPPAHDIYVTTYWKTVEWAIISGWPNVVHFCQGFEGDLIHLRHELPAIEAVYRHPLTTWVVSPMLARRLAVYGRKASVIPPFISTDFRPAFRFRPRAVPRILITGMFEAAVKNVPTALRVIIRMREAGLKCRVERLSVYPQTSEERELLEVDAYHHHLSPHETARLMREFDLLLFTSREMEGFGLPVLEAMRSGVPVVIARIPSLEPFTTAGIACADPEDIETFATEATKLLRHSSAWRSARRRGLAAASRYSESVTHTAVLSALPKVAPPK